MRSFDVKVFANAVECFEVEKVSRADYTAFRVGGETLLYRVSVSHKRGKVKLGRDRAASYCFYHAKNLHPDYKFVVSEVLK